MTTVFGPASRDLSILNRRGKSKFEVIPGSFVFSLLSVLSTPTLQHPSGLLGSFNLYGDVDLTLIDNHADTTPRPV
jgi:hypothetical protein